MARDRFGVSHSIEQGVVVVGNLHPDENQEGTGSVYVLNTRFGGVCEADLTGEGVLDIFDVSVFLQAFAAGCP